MPSLCTIKVHIQRPQWFGHYLSPSICLLCSITLIISIFLTFCLAFYLAYSRHLLDQIRLVTIMTIKDIYIPLNKMALYSTTKYYKTVQTTVNSQTSQKNKVKYLKAYYTSLLPEQKSVLTAKMNGIPVVRMNEKVNKPSYLATY